MSTKKKMTIGLDDYIKANKKLAREEELQRNGGRWVAKDRPHKNLKKYDRKRDKKNFDSYLSLFLLDLLLLFVFIPISIVYVIQIMSQPFGNVTQVKALEKGFFSGVGTEHTVSHENTYPSGNGLGNVVFKTFIPFQVFQSCRRWDRRDDRCTAY